VCATDRAPNVTWEIWCNVGPEARNLPVVSDGPWGTRAARTPTQTRMREEKSPVGPQGEGLVFETIREMMAKTFEELDLRPKAPLPLEDVELPESDEDEADITEISGFNSWQAQGDVATSATPFAPREHEPVSCATVAASVANATTPTTRQITQEELQAEIYRIADAWNGVTQDRDRPHVGDRVCVACQRRRSNAQSHCECNEGLYWTIPEQAWIEPVSRLESVTVIIQSISIPGVTYLCYATALAVVCPPETQRAKKSMPIYHAITAENMGRRVSSTTSWKK
jgi:hypothetical protein